MGRETGKSNEETAKTIRYVIYVRKSTDTAEKQERSIGDQTIECKQLADRLGLRWVEVIHEEQSAMISDGRPKFREMLNELKHGDSYEGIIAWASDRLARNMKAALGSPSLLSAWPPPREFILSERSESKDSGVRLPKHMP